MLTPTQEFRRTRIKAARELPKGLDALVDQWIGAYQRRISFRDELLAQACLIDGLAAQYEVLADHNLKQKLATYRELIRRSNRIHDRVIHHALAAIREASHRKLGLRPFVVQLAGTLGLYRGCLTEMATGEGKTLSASLAAILEGWSGKPCHVVTVNDYLAQRDAAWMSPLFAFCGVKTGYVTGAMQADDRTRGYAQDVTYCTGKEMVADFLRDRLRLGRYQNASRRQVLLLLQPRLKHLPGVVMRGVHSAIVDEADSVMIDEAVTPVIIAASHANEPLKEACRIAREIAGTLERNRDFFVNQKYREIELLEEGRKKISALAGRFPGLWRAADRHREIVTQALTARELFVDGRHYAIRGDKVQIVDEFTGRIMAQRSWRAGLHQAIEAKEGLEISDPTETLARLSFQRFFRFFSRLSGMTGTAREAEDEFWRVYKLPVISIPPNRPCQRRELPDVILGDAASKWAAVVEDIKNRHALGQPILVGTRSITNSELLSAKLETIGLPHKVLNALRDGEEARIVSGAGQAGQITIATNMAGRGTDIKLGGGVEELGGLHVIGTDRHDSQRVDRQLHGRSGRQGSPGSAQTFVSVEDELLKRYLPGAVANQLASAFRNKRPGSEALVKHMFDRSQRIAQRHAFRQRMGVLAMDTWMENSLSFAGIEYA
jgi:preprotein translocase subunit SecA